MDRNASLLSRIVTWTIVGVLAILAFKIVARLLVFLLGLLGTALGIVAFLLFTIGPVVLLGWLAVKGWNAFTKAPTA